MADHRSGWHALSRGDDAGPARIANTDHCVAGRHKLIKRNQSRGLALAHEVRGGRSVRQYQVTHHRTRFLGQPGLVKPCHFPSIEHGGSRQDLGGCDHARSTDSSETNGKGSPHLERHRVANLGRLRPNRRDVATCLDLHEGRTVAFDTGVVEVAGSLMNDGLAAKRGVNRLD